MKTFQTTYKGREIIVENRWFKGEKLYVDGSLQDENRGLSFRSSLYGVLPAENGSEETLKASVGGGLLRVQCSIFAGHKLIYSSSD
ncbi:hypothetical protein [Alkalicoccus saliphilus]|uniref:Uncharacterized protein n=1 Tax=Alkalicoccus saliphilus TaxID=200989 RepID=A0A2T4U396_9BACI|nr:hypothetical protein [Alkalicoccus saliphilus]PTL37883.1 hypothetical protein C6Y45_14165 [Alkalicoccus saliphilus]